MRLCAVGTNSIFPAETLAAGTQTPARWAGTTRPFTRDSRILNSIQWSSHMSMGLQHELEAELEGELETEIEGELEVEGELEFETEGEVEGEEFFRRLRRVARGIGGFVRRAAPVLRNVARVAAPLVGRAVGTALGGPAGTLI